ncbi:serine hydrolase domain-containing protein [Caulobacter sp. 17J65-9]|uniref:serine hydrolase domain-containing protein n=1 Tax=Caulobacter sp. 17J65-9 TaxID=2709382 RepID=UPI0013C894DB|nr:serine hydrolase domain-containing protein [Caulobacter sp. 17J65-9]NEX93234.1 serine hydrolase [Caulobacter sp. 17J65-9]
MVKRLRSWKAVALAVALLGGGALPASGRSAPPKPPMTAIAPTTPGAAQLTSQDLNVWLDGYMPRALNDAGIAGGVVTIVKDGQIVTNRGFGYANLKTRTPVDPNATLFRPGSISKLFTWTAVMQLVEQGKLDLDADVNQYLDFKVPAQGKPVTLRQIMTHTTGYEEVVRELFDNNADLTLKDYLTRNLPERIHAPGTTPAYSNYATALAGYIVQRVSGEPFPKYIERHIFTPLGMQNSTFEQPLPDRLKSAMSGGYRNLDSDEAQKFEIIGPGPAGALSSTGADMAKFMNAYLNGGAGLMKPETARLMFDTIDQQFPGVNSMGLGFYQNDLNGHRIMGHGGDTGWFHSDLALMIDDHVGVYVSLNSAGNTGLAPHLLRIDFLKAFVDRYYPAATLTADPKPLDTAKAHGAAVVGDYESSRRIDSNPLHAIYFLDQTKVAMAPNGDLIGPGLPTATGKPRHWREVEPWIWQEVGGYNRMGVRRDASGKVTALAAEPFSFAIVNTRAPWWRATSTWTPLLIAAVAVLALTFLTWPLRALVRRAHRAPFPYADLRAKAHRMAGVSSGLVVAYLAGWTGFLVWLLGSLPDTPESVASAFFVVLYVAGLLPVLALGGLTLANLNLWRGGASWFARIWGGLTVPATLVILWLAIANGFYSFNFSY